MGAAIAGRVRGFATSGPDVDRHVERLGRVAVATQGLVYLVVGLLAAEVAGGDRNAKASQQGAIQSVARQPLGHLLLIGLAVGLASHAAWRAVLAIRGEPGQEDGSSVAKRIGNVGRAVVYASLTFAAVRILSESGSAGGGGDRQAARSTSIALGLPGGRLLVVVAGAAVIGAGLWNGYRGVTRHFVRSLDLSSLDDGRRHLVELLGTAGYLARAVAFSLVGWFLLASGLHRDPRQTRGLDGALHELAGTSKGPVLLLVVALGLVMFGVYRMLDAVYRRSDKLTSA